MTNIKFPRVQLLIDGEWTDGTSGETLEILNPATGDLIGLLPLASKSDIDRALAAAQEARHLEKYLHLRSLQDLAQGCGSDAPARAGDRPNHLVRAR